MSKTTNLKLRASKEIELIKSFAETAEKDLKNYVKEQRLTRKAITYLFEEGRPEMIQVYVNTVFPDFCKFEFKKYQTKVMKYADRKTLATYYMYHEVSANGEIELIKRGEVKPFAYYIANHGLTAKAFKFLVKEGSSELLEAYLANNNIAQKALLFFIQHGSVSDVVMYFMGSSSDEKDLFIEKLNQLKNTARYQEICEANEIIGMHAMYMPPVS
jgi:hypothetical protein